MSVCTVVNVSLVLVMMTSTCVLLSPVLFLFFCFSFPRYTLSAWYCAECQCVLLSDQFSVCFSLSPGEAFKVAALQIKAGTRLVFTPFPSEHQRWFLPSASVCSILTSETLICQACCRRTQSRLVETQTPFLKKLVQYLHVRAPKISKCGLKKATRVRRDFFLLSVVVW